MPETVTVKKSPSQTHSQLSQVEHESISGLSPKQQDKYRRRFARIIKDITQYAKNPDLELLKNAYRFALNAHREQSRLSGDPYIDHCLGTSKILTELRMDASTVAAGLIHDVVEDTGITIANVVDEFGPEIGKLVDGVTKIGELKFKSQAQQQAENFRKMIFSMAEDLRVIMIKFADRLHNMRTLQHVPPEKAKRIAIETRDVYAPLAHRFGVARIKWELEDLAFKTIHPDIYQDLVKQVAEKKGEREKTIRRLVRPIKKELIKNGITAEVIGRAKTLHSIYLKMKYRQKPFEEIYDLLAIRIIVDKVDECYFALGVVHTLFTPLHDQFKDYIATPKLNMYQSLHTTVVGPEGKLAEIQVRTNAMHRVAEIGIAAHWKYKEGRESEDELDRYSAWLREMVDWQKDTLDPEEYMDILKTDLFISEVFVFTPKGDLIKLPNGSTPVDFAFMVHTDVGLHCIGAKINGRIVPLNSKLKSGDSIEIITSKNQRPHQDWITFVQTSKAKSKIKRWFREKQNQEAVHLGEEILHKGLKRYRIQLTKTEMQDLAASMGRKRMERFYADLGHGELSLRKILERIAPEKLRTTPDKKKDNLIEKFVTRARGTAKGIRVQGMDQLLIRFAQCCQPVPGDPIVGFITKGRGIVIHRKYCANAARLQEFPEKIIEVAWDVGSEEAFLIQLRILAEGRKEFLKDVTTSLANMDIHIKKADMINENSTITSYLILEVKDLSQLTKIMRKLCRLKGILSVERSSSIEKSAG